MTIDSRTMQERLEWLLDRQAVVDVLFQYARSLDTRDWDLMARLFTEGAIVEFDGPARGILPVRLVGLDEIMNEYRTFFGICGATYHVSMNHEVSIDGDVATMRAAYRDLDEREDGDDTMCVENLGFFDATMIRASDGWKIDHLHGTTVLSPRTTEQEIFASVAALPTTKAQLSE